MLGFPWVCHNGIFVRLFRVGASTCSGPAAAFNSSWNGNQKTTDALRMKVRPALKRWMIHDPAISSMISLWSLRPVFFPESLALGFHSNPGCKWLQLPTAQWQIDDPDTDGPRTGRSLGTGRPVTQWSPGSVMSSPKKKHKPWFIRVVFPP